MIKLGLISYGLYLWHYPVLWLLGFFDKRPWPGLVVGAIGVGISLALAIASYVWVEARFRKPHSPRTRDVPIPVGVPAT
jgi:peptidoglycan/LPS O-acetylase OafA/YrhL